MKNEQLKSIKHDDDPMSRKFWKIAKMIFDEFHFKVRW